MPRLHQSLDVAAGQRVAAVLKDSMPVVASNEPDRLSALHRLQLLDTPPEAAFERLVALARVLFDVPIALISLVDTERQWFKAKCGLAVNETSREFAFCDYTILHDTVFVVPDATRNATFSQNPLVTGEPRIRFYAGAPLVVGPGLRLGSFCIIDTKPRAFGETDSRNLRGLAQAALSEIWLRDLQASNTAHRLPLKSELETTKFEFSDGAILTGAQVRAARGLLNWSIAQLSLASGVASNTIKRLEASEAELNVRDATKELVVNAFKTNGVVFTGRSASTAGIQYTSDNIS